MLRWVAAFLLLASMGSADGATLAGTVVEDHSGSELVSARVRVRAASGEVVADRDSDSSGRFETPELPPGSYRIEISKRNYLGAWLRVEHPGPPVEARLSRLGVIAGRAVDSAGKPLAKAFVFVLAAEGDAFVPAQARRTGSDGEFRLHGLTPGRYAVGVSRADYQYAQGSAGGVLYPSNAAPEVFEIAGGEVIDQLQVVLPSGPGVVVAGRLEGRQEGARYVVGLTYREQPALGAALSDVKPDGTFELPPVQPGSYELTAGGPTRGHSYRGAILGPERLYGRMSLEVGGQATNDLVVELKPGRRLAAALEYESPEARSVCPASVSVGARLLDSSGIVMSEKKPASEEAPAVFEKLAPGRYWLDAERLPSGCFLLDAPWIDLSEDDAETALTLAAAGRIEGRLLGSDEPQRFPVALGRQGSAEKDESLRLAYPDADGRFVFEALRPGGYRIAARRPEDNGRWVRSDETMFEIDVAGGAATEIDLPAPREEAP